MNTKCNIHVAKPIFHLKSHLCLVTGIPDAEKEKYGLFSFGLRLIRILG